MMSSLDFPCCARAACCPARSTRAKISRDSPKKNLAAFGERHLRLLRSNSGDAYVRLKLLDLLAEGRLSGVEPLSGAGEVQLFGDRHEVPQVAQFHLYEPRLV